MTIVGLAAITRDLSVSVVVGALLLLVTVVRGAAVERAALVARIGAIAWVVSSAVFLVLSLIHISEPTRRTPISYAVFCLKKKKKLFHKITKKKKKKKI